MISGVRALSQNLSEYGRSLHQGLRAAAALAHPAEEPVRAIESADASSDTRLGPEQPHAGHEEPPPDLAEAAIDIAASRAAVRASVALVRTQNEMLGSLIDILA